MTRVQVSYSSIRPNDRGKEVPSFVIVVDPGSGKEPWKVEKLYKLWRDHAPAKVDQRKASLRVIRNCIQLMLAIREGRTGELPPGHPFASSQRPK